MTTFPVLPPPRRCGRILAEKGGDNVAKLEFEGIDDLMDDLENAPFDCVCSVCGKQFQATQEQLLQPTVTCPHCGAELEDV